ncbi:MAG: DUF6712 family protein [Janthinobacterium lividum]
MTPLFTTDAELKDYLPTTAAFKLQQLQPSLKRALAKYLREAVGLVQLTALGTAYAAGTGTLSPAEAALLDAVRLPLATFAAALHVGRGPVQLGATGPVVSEGQNLKPASAKDVATMTDSQEDAGFEGIEALLELLEDNRADYPLWAASDACTILHGQFLATAKEFDKYVFIDRSRRRFLELQPAIRDVERLYLLPVMGAPLIAELRDQLTKATVTVLNIELLTYVRPVVANLALRDDELRQATGEQYLDDLRAFLYDRANDYPLFMSSPAYKPDVAIQLIQDPEWGFYAAL